MTLELMMFTENKVAPSFSEIKSFVDFVDS
jgi:uncharacterized protein Usg